jgi:hypothetical protein
MTPDERASQAINRIHFAAPQVSMRESIARAIQEAEAEKINDVLALIKSHQKHDSYVFLEELEGEIKQLKQSASSADPT